MLDEIVDSQAGFSLSPQQQRIVSMTADDPVLPYIVRGTLSVRGVVDAERLQRALAAVAARHEILRTRFVSHSGLMTLLQVIMPEISISVEHAPPSTANDRKGNADLPVRFSQRDMHEGRLIHCTLTEASAKESSIDLSIAAVCADAASIRIIARDLVSAYVLSDAQTQPDVVVQYADVAEHFNSLLRSEEGSVGRQYWQPRLAASRTPQVSSSLPRAKTTRFAPQVVRASIPDAVLTKFRHRPSTAAFSDELFLLTCWQSLLTRLSETHEFSIGYCAHGRDMAELEDCVGPCERYLPVVVHCWPDMSFEDSLRATHEAVEEALLWQSSFEWSQANQYHPVCFSWYDGAWDLGADGIGVYCLRLDACSDRFDLKLSCVHLESATVAELWYIPSAYPWMEARQLLSQFVNLVESAVAAPDAAILELNTIGEGERNQLLVEWNQTTREFGAFTCIHEMFEGQAANQPDRIALVHEEHQISYGELNRRANQLGRYLIAMGVGPEVRVGVCMERSPEMIVGFLGVLKAGGAYVPLEPSHPAERLSYMMEDTGLLLLLTQSRLQERLSAIAKLKVLCPGSAPSDIAEQNDANIGREIAAANLAYVIYTSGSTGRPKGIGVEHRQLANYVQAVSERLELEAGWRMALMTTPAADLGYTVLFPALSIGATLHVLDDERARDPLQWNRYCQERDIDCIKIVPSHMRALMMDGGGTGVPRRLLVLGGEASNYELIDALKEQRSGCSVVNHYGPTECCVGTVTHSIVESDTGNVPLGTPLGNVRCYVVDLRGRLSPQGAPGELCIGGNGVARGYLNQAGMTAEKFVPDPFSGRVGERLYRTGDRVRWRCDGNLEFLGRFDDQVKVRGYRIELKEVESVLNTHPQVIQAAVVVREDEPGERQLVAYVVPREPSPEKLCAGHPRFLLPNGMSIVHQNTVETQYQYEEIFRQQGYLRMGVILPEDACVVDVGANIGMFALFAGQSCPRGRVYAFEPLWETFERLRINAKLYGDNRIHVYPYGLSVKEGNQEFVFYPRYSMLSGVLAYADAKQDQDMLARYSSIQASEKASVATKLEPVEDLLAEHLKGEIQTCHVRALSDMMREEGIDGIDLLKIDVQRAELDVLLGVDDEHWPVIRQVVLEVHDEQRDGRQGNLAAVVEFLRSRGFETAVQQEGFLAGSDRYNLYAVRPQSRNELLARSPGLGWKQGPAKERKELSTADLRGYLLEKLPEYMIPGTFVFLDSLPLMSNGKLDRSALPKPQGPRGNQRRPPRNAEEEILCAIFSEVLKQQTVGVDENFFELGGHSLLATQAISRIRNVFGVDLPVRTIFEQPTVAGLADRVRTARGARQRPSIPLGQADREHDLPLSYAQQRLWFVDQMEPGNPLYNMPFGIRLQGSLNKEALERSVNRIVARHEVLRTTFPAVDGKAIQKISPVLDLRVEETDLSGIEQGQIESEAKRLAAQESSRGFDLAAGPLVRARLLRLGDRDHVLLLTVHHIVCDGWSMPLIVHEFCKLYEAFVLNVKPALPEIKIQYADYAVWQREWLGSEVLAEQLEYWKTQLEDVTTLELPTDYRRPRVLTHKGGTLSFHVSNKNAEGLEALSQKHGVTLFMSLLAAFQLLLGRWSGQQDVAVGVPIANRNRLETEGLIGFFVNTLVLRTKWTETWSFPELLRRVREIVLEAYEYQDMPFEKLVEELEPERELNRSSLFQVMLLFQNAPQEELRLPGLRIDGFGGGAEGAKFDLTMEWRRREQGLEGTIGFARDLFREVTIQRLSQQLGRLLEWVVVHEETPVGAFEILTESERRQLLNDWNATVVRYPQGQTLHGLFEEQVRLQPDGIALTYGDQFLSFGEMERRSNQLGHYLRRHGIGPEVCVGVCLERNLELVLVLLGVLKAGGMYLAVDIRLPAARLEFLMSDAHPRVALTRGAVVARLREPAATIIQLDSGWSAISQESTDPVQVAADPQNPAYVIYTSGSTGVPKGVPGIHATTLNRFYWMWNKYPFELGEVCCQKTSLNFVDSVWEIFGPLLAGITAVIIPDQLAKDPKELARELARRRVTRIVLVPSLLQALLDSPDQVLADLAGVRIWVSSGEALPFELAAQWAKRFPGCTLLNLYGSSEVAADVTSYEMKACMPGGETREQITAAIGAPIANTQAYVLDERMNLFPAGGIGELYIGGAGVGRGYLNRAEITAENFVPNPFSERPGERLYRTGDLVRWLPEGALEFVGRRDHQVKIRGVRIELGEIEAVLARVEGVVQSAVLVWESSSAEKRLVGYVVSREPKLGQADLRIALKEQLPEYMVPVAFVLLQRMPMTPSGKLDRKALPAPEFGPSDAGGYTAPRTPAEETLVNLWMQLLGAERVGVHDNFFDIGGHSLLATQLIARIRKRAGVELPVQSVFESPTVAGLALKVEHAQRAGHKPAMPPLVRRRS